MTEKTGDNLRKMSKDELGEVYGKSSSAEVLKRCAGKVSAFVVSAAVGAPVSACVSYTLSMLAKCR